MNLRVAKGWVFVALFVFAGGLGRISNAFATTLFLKTTLDDFCYFHYRNCNFMSRVMTILVIDDDEDDLDFFKMTLATVNNTIRCITMNDADIALDQISTNEIVPDYIVTELHM